MYNCNVCKKPFRTHQGRQMHYARWCKIPKTKAPDLMSLGVIKRKLTRDEAKKLTKEVMAMGLKDPDARFSMAIIKAIEVTN